MNQEHRAYPDVDAYLDSFAAPMIDRLCDDGDKATFIGHELDKWERIERRLEEWARRGDGSPNPYSPPLDLGRVSSIIVELNGCLEWVRERKACAPQLVAAE